MEAAVTERTVAIMLEPIQGEVGGIPTSESYLKSLREIAGRHGLLRTSDEIEIGMGRTGALFCFEHPGAQPDIITLGKGIGAGVPLAAVLAEASSLSFLAHAAFGRVGAIVDPARSRAGAGQGFAAGPGPL